ncbi:MAG: PAS domain S-box domain-containing protein [Parcubacteria group bacterium GW2011_GWF2_38_76]|nr:MAG: PAS domain S-box domain-containing protein [Parcubacteria group bacterium GW2011_GWF2_38_76]HBM45452.1 hypothetical protein [Patescibacteria group bacterium]
MESPTKSDAINSDTTVKEVKKIILQLEAIVEESHDAIIGKTLDGTIVTWNGGATKMFGYTREEMIGRSIAELFAPGNRDELPGLLERIKKGETIADYDSIWIKKDGTNAEVEFSLSPVHVKEGLVIGSSLVGRDVTEHKRVAGAIQSMANFPMENPYPVFRMSEEGKVLFANKASEIFSLSAGSIAPDFWVNLAKDVFQKKENIENVEFGVNERVFSINIVPILDKRYVNVYGEEITLRKKAEEIIKKDQKLIQGVVDNSDSLIYVVDVEGNFLLINNKMERLFGASRGQLLGKKRESILSREIAEDHHANDIKVITTKTPLIFEEESQEKDGLHHYLSVKFPIFDDGGNVYAVGGISVDITERKKAEEELTEANIKILGLQRTKNEFVSLAAHQLRSPITTILGNASILVEQIKKGEGGFTEEQRGTIEDMVKGTKDMNYLVEFLLKITRAETGKTTLTLVPVDLRDVVETEIEVLGSELDPKNQTVEIVQDPTPFPFVFLDKEMIKQVILNLLSNASRYSPNDSVIKVSMIMKDEYVEISVKDDGIGIPKEAQDKIFSRFYRADNAMAMVSGTGLGLALTKALVEVWGGKIWFESEENKGTTFYFTMPIVGKTETKKGIVL